MEKSNNRNNIKMEKTFPVVEVLGRRKGVKIWKSGCLNEIIHAVLSLQI